MPIGLKGFQKNNRFGHRLQKGHTIGIGNKNGTVHGFRYTREYNSWVSMKQRCLIKTSPDWLRYGGRGILYHPEWELFQNFLRDMGLRPFGMTLDRINNNEGYEMNNCRWSTPKEQAKNRQARKRKVVL